MKPRFKTWHLLIFVAAGACVFAFLTKREYQTTLIQIVENRLSVKTTGEINGHIIWCVTEETQGDLESPFVICSFENYVPAHEPKLLLELQRGNEFPVKWISQQLFFSGEHPYDVFIVRELKIDPDKVTGIRDGLLTQFAVSG